MYAGFPSDPIDELRQICTRKLSPEQYWYGYHLYEKLKEQ